jgi:hypothetical protein
MRLAEAGARRVRLCVLVANVAARSTYARAGYAPHEVIYEKQVGEGLGSLYPPPAALKISTDSSVFSRATPRARMSAPASVA